VAFTNFVIPERDGQTKKQNKLAPYGTDGRLFGVFAYDVSAKFKIT